MPFIDPLSTSTSLLNDVRCGDQQAWFRFVETYTPLIESWCRQHHIRAVDTDDVVQNVYAVVAKHAENFGCGNSENSFVVGCGRLLIQKLSISYGQQKSSRTPSEMRE